MFDNNEIINIQSNPNLFINNNDIDFIEKTILYFNKLYYNNESPISDYQYDLLYDGLKKKYKDKKLNFENSSCYKIGSNVLHNQKHKLPFYCGSLDKIKPNSNELNNFLNKYKSNFLISEKIDGIPLIIEFNCKNFKIFTRGNGKEGLLLNNKILNIIDYPISNIMNKFTYFCIKGECVLNKNSNYNTNLRNVVNGILHKKEINDNIKLNYIAYEILSPRMNILNQYNMLNKLGFKIPKFLMRNNFDNIETIYKVMRNKSDYNIDGLVITHNENYPCLSNKNPDYSKAFKMILNQQIKETIVTDVIWNVSKNGYLKPTIIFNPINIDNTNINKTTGFNAKYIIDNNIGKNTKLKIIKSGDVIPYVHSIISSTNPILPNIKYKWNRSKIDFIITDLNDTSYKKSLLLHFCKEMEIKYINDGIIEILFNNGIQNINNLININIDFLNSLPKFNETLSNKIYKSIIEKTENPNLLNLLIASNSFGNGIGKKKMETLLNEIPNLLTINIDDDLKIKINNVNGFNDLTTNKIINGIIEFKKFINNNKIKINLEFKTNIKSNKLQNKSFVLSGFRDNDLENKIISFGGKINTSISNKTDYLIVNDLNQKSKKIDEAKKLNLNIISKNNFNSILYG